MRRFLGFTALISLPMLPGVAAVAAPVASNLQLWLDSSDASTVSDAEGDNPGDVGFDGTVNTWSDKSGNSRHATAVNNTATQRPTYNAAALNGQGVVRMNVAAAEQEAFNLAGSVITNGETMFFVLDMLSNGNNEGHWVSNVSGSNFSAFTNDEDRYFLYAAGPSNFALISNSAPSATFQVVDSVRETTTNNWTVYEDGASVGSATRSNGLTLNAVGYSAQFGARYFRGDMAEVIIYDRTLNTAERVVTENYLASKYDRALAANDRYSGDTALTGHYDIDVFGIGEDAASTVSGAGALTAGAGGALA